jgi:hypothetical protein
MNKRLEARRQTMTTQVMTSTDREAGQGKGRLAPTIRRAESERVIHANREWYPGLCSTCDSEPTCTFPGSSDRLVTACDEFAGGTGLVSRTIKDVTDTAERFAVANREWYPGLWMTCAKQDECTLPMPDGGVYLCGSFEKGCAGNAWRKEDTRP